MTMMSSCRQSRGYSPAGQGRSESGGGGFKKNTQKKTHSRRVASILLTWNIQKVGGFPVGLP